VRLYYGDTSLKSMSYQVGEISPMYCMQVVYLPEKPLAHITKIHNFLFGRKGLVTGSQLELK
jgi:hypothetical protein